MTELVKAHLTPIDKNGTEGTVIPVQFNPSTLTIQMTNSNDGASSRGRQTQQYNGTASTQLNVDLEFDTADEGPDPVDVRTKTDLVRQFVLPGGTKSKQAPPRVKFGWGTFELTGVMNSLSEELSLFSRNGVPLRSKLTIQIKEQDARFAALKTGPGANDDTDPSGAGEQAKTTNGPGSAGGGPINAAANALAGETAADFLARNGLAPEAWRAVGAALGALGEGTELSAGVSIGFDASLSASVGVGVAAGIRAGLGAATSTTLGLDGDARAPLTQGFALASAGGVTAASESALATDAAVAAAWAREGFAPAPRTTAATTDPSPPSHVAARAPLSDGAGARTQPATAAAAAPAPPRADRRSITFGRGVPLRERVEVPGAEPDGYVVIGKSEGAGSLTGAAPWERVPVASGASAAATGCGCGGGRGTGGNGVGGAGGGCGCGGRR